MPITSLASLERHLQWAIQLELTTIPPYLCALYSIKDGHNLPAQALIRGVVMEEMLHVTLAANLLNAIGGTPRLAHADVVPRYPGKLPHSDGKLTVKLLPFSPAAIAAFRAIEHPAPAGAEARRATPTTRSASSTRRSPTDSAGWSRRRGRARCSAATVRGR